MNPSMTESTCCTVARTLGGHKCPICDRPIRLAKVLRLLRHDARAWWWFRELRARGQQDEARRLERASIRREVTDIRANIDRPIQTYRTSVIEFTDTMHRRPFSLTNTSDTGRTVCLSGCHPGFFAAFVYCYANKIGQTWTAKPYDTI